MLADLWHSPTAASTIGCSTTGSSEAAMLGGLALKWKWRKRLRAAGKSTDAPNLIMGPVQVCWHKFFCRYFDVEIREVPMDGERLLLTPEEVVQRCDENTIGVIVTLGVTFTLQYEPVLAISQALDDLQARTGLDIPIHVDGASGAFLAPFVTPELVLDFRLPRVKSINASGHNSGLPRSVSAGHSGGKGRPATGTDLRRELPRRQYANLRSQLFPAGWRDHLPVLQLSAARQRRIPRHPARLLRARPLSRGKIAAFGPFRIIYDGEGGIPGLCWELKDPVSASFTLYEFADRLRERGWLVPAYSLPANREDMVIQRILIRHGFTQAMADTLLGEMKKILMTLRSSHRSRTPPWFWLAPRPARMTIPADRQLRRSADPTCCCILSTTRSL